MDLIIQSAFCEVTKNARFNLPFLIYIPMNTIRTIYPFAVKLLDRCVGSCNTLYDLSNKVCVPNKTEDLNLSVFNMITGINESNTSTKHISCECKCKLDGTKCNSNQWSNNDNINVSLKSIMYVKKIIFGKYLASIMDDSVITCDEGIE